MAAPRKPDLLHRLHGTANNIHNRASDTSQVPAGRPRIPKDITERGLRRQFKAMCKTLAERRVLTAGDMDLIRLFVILQARHIEEATLLAREGTVVTYYRLDSHGQSVPQVKKNIRYDICVTTERQMADVLTRLGLSPTAKDRAKPTGATNQKIVPGSIRELHPEWFDANGKYVRPADRISN
jgi:P27 family predicted phage terminase small subunit